ncbi:3-hydroxyacyl-CoA dehydrogenase NAD-binding domain-containing protein [Rugamonas apoptosis]|uniref:Enoyl-CoA hydratase/isomerase family protein n=1 Tax=Rugamonas apoptosis TaxID=2758570 RepID=A0A7W2ILK2_9BURK|nr:3-hydroxyacyl-CoA dehydrogenase NAD-binding domain-containing protein [Rugamonas apoptosis]MBA5688890.1 enoyl-CoA hydratase/isomerase family protein [Rugamonas apoptosis]
MNSPVTFVQEGSIGLIRIDNRPVNAVSPRVVAALEASFAEFEERGSLDALVIYCAGRTFVAGADIAWFDSSDFNPQAYNRLLARIEASERPVVAALHGTVLGAGLELALACHWRVAEPGTKLGLPEVKLGLLPGSLGTQRLPRLLGAGAALGMMLSGAMAGVQQALQDGLIDEVCEGEARAAGKASAQRLVATRAALRRTSALAAPVPPDGGFAQYVTDAARKPQYPARVAIVRCVEAAVERSFMDGEQVEAREFATLLGSATSKSLRHLFFSEREAARIPGLSDSTAPQAVRRVGIVGAGTMGGGIAMNFVNANIPTVLLDTTEAALQRGLDLIRKNYMASAAKGKLTAEQVEQRMGLLTGALEYTALADCDLIIEAVFEDLELKKQVCARIGGVAKSGAIIATNTSTLDVNVLARAAGRPERVLGMHFFSPANVMRLLEVVRGDDTAPEVLATVMKLAKAIGKTPVVSGVCFGFIGNRMLEPYLREMEFLLMEGAEPKQIDAAAEALGMAMGPCRMIDMAGVDVGAKVVIERGKAGELPADPAYRAVVRKLFELGRYGQKTGAGHYRYDGRTPVHDPEFSALARALGDMHGVARRTDISGEEIVERLFYPLINEGLRILDEGIAYRPGDIDVVWTAGYGFPDHCGGPMFMAEQTGLTKIAQRLRHYARVRGDAFGYWTPSSLLTRLAETGEPLSKWTRTA